MKKFIHYIMILFFCFIASIDVKAQYKIENDWYNKYFGRMLNIDTHVCGGFFDKLPMSITMQYQGGEDNYHTSCVLHLYTPKEFPPEVLILLKGENGKIIEILGKLGSNNYMEKTKIFCDGKPYYRYQVFINFDLTSEKLKELILAKIIKIRIETETTPLDKSFNKNEFSNTLFNFFLTIQKRLHPELFRDKVREGF